MTIQIGNIAIKYDGPGCSRSYSNKFASTVDHYLQVRNERNAHQSEIGSIVRRWLVAPAIVGIIVGVMIQ